MVAAEQAAGRSSLVWQGQVGAVLDAMPDPVAVFGARRDGAGEVVELEYLFINAAALRGLDRGREDFIGHGLLELFPSVRGSDLWARYMSLISSGEDAIIDVPWFAENGVLGSFTFSASRFGDGLIVTARDVTDRVLAEERLRYELDLNNAMLDIAGALIVVVDAEWRIVRFNRQSELLTGYREAEVVGRHYRFLIPPSERSDVAGNLESVSAGHPVSQVNHWLSKDGEQRLIRWSNAGLLGADGRHTYLIAIGIDITDQQRAEAEVAQRAAELEVANRELARSNTDLEQFAYIASHDLREPVRAVSMPLELIARRYKGRQLDETAEEYIDLAVDGSQRLQQMIDGLLVYSRVGRVEGAVEATDAGQAARQALTALEPILDETQAVVTVGALPVVLAEADQLARVFQELIGNAVTFVAPDVIPRVDVTAEQRARQARFTVTDNGIGIAPAHRERVFTMFKRLQPRDEHSGVGVGLALVKKIVERHGGQVGIEDASTGSGSRFWFTLPTPAEPDD